MGILIPLFFFPPMRRLRIVVFYMTTPPAETHANHLAAHVDTSHDAPAEAEEPVEEEVPEPEAEIAEVAPVEVEQEEEKVEEKVEEPVAQEPPNPVEDIEKKRSEGSPEAKSMNKSSQVRSSLLLYFVIQRLNSLYVNSLRDMTILSK